MTAPGPAQSYCDTQAVPEGVRIRCRRVPLEPGIVLTPHQWADLHTHLARGELPGFAVELPNSWVTKIAPPGQEDHALYLWRDEIVALAHELRTGRHPQLEDAVDRSTVDDTAGTPTSMRAGSPSVAAAATPTSSADDIITSTDQSPSIEADHAEESSPAGLDLSTSQVDLLTAMAAFRWARIVDGVVRVGSGRHSMRDLYALRTAKLVRASRDGRGLRDRKRFEITDRGATQARRLTQAGGTDGAAVGVLESGTDR
ncbi:hypothetical protein GCM10009687_67980 [Asanoa iriomotensis]|uniref:MarR family transcriptional regulator n=2 Tax=Asanoa iriomotensis TaxID=234613 RepID=A0ABQ4C5E2_9ACTN|nr:hypothetical protein Air01nite_40970 [Asanoa iriomotensis]